MNSGFDHLIKRRRKRRPAIDPCLGFYPSQEPVLCSQPTILPAVQLPSIPAKNQVNLSQERSDFQPDEPDQPSATEISDKIPKTYAKQSRKRLYNYESEKECSASSPPPLKRRKTSSLRVKPIHDARSRNNGWKKRKLADRLLQAAVLSGVDPVDSLIEPDPNAPTPARKPLRFIMVDSLDSSPSKPKHRPIWSLVDPHRSSSIRTASFISARERETLPRRDYKPLTQWPSTSSRPNRDVEAVPQSTKRRAIAPSSTKLKANTDMQFKRRQLKLVPIQESELNFRRSSRRVPRNTQVASDSVNSSRVMTVAINSTSVNSTRTPSAKHSANGNTGSRIFSSPKQPAITIQIDSANDTKKPVSDSCTTSSTLPAAVPIVSEPKVSPEPIGPTVSDPHADVAVNMPSSHTSAITQPEVVSSHYPHPISPTHLDQSSIDSQSHSRPSIASSKRPLKPLSSFFDEFLETVRAATKESQRQNQKLHSIDTSGQRKRSSQARPLTSSRRAEDYDLIQDRTRHLRDVGSDYAFDEWSCRDRGEEKKEENKNNWEMHPTSSPDVLTTSRSSQYQATLSVESPSTVNSLRGAMEGLRAFYR